MPNTKSGRGTAKNRSKRPRALRPGGDVESTGATTARPKRIVSDLKESIRGARFRYGEVLETVMRGVTRGLKTSDRAADPKEAEQVSQAFQRERDRIDRLSSLIKITAVVNSSLNEQEVLNSILEHATQVTGAEASSIILRGEDDHSLYFLAATGEKADEVKRLKLEIGEGIAGWVVAHGQSVRSDDVHRDSRFSSRISDSVNFPSKSIACSPMKIRNRVIGAIEVINRRDGHPFNDDDMEILEAFANQAAIAIENARLFKLAITDELTSLYSHRYFKDYLHIEMQKAKRLKRTMSIVLMDIDNFKRFNDAYGHAVGDSVLRGVSGILKKSLRETDVIARYGGEELAIILSELTRDQAASIADRLRGQIAEFKVAADGGMIGVTVSVGLATYPDCADNESDLFDRADKALYEAKRAGKNCVRLAKPQ